MKKEKAPRTKPSKRNPMQDVASEAARAAKYRVADKAGEAELRAALNHPKDVHGKPIAGHLIKTMAANQLRVAPERNHVVEFEFAAQLFLTRLTYQQWGGFMTVSNLWAMFLKMIRDTDPENVRLFTETHRRDFGYLVLGHVHRLELEYDQQPYALVMVEIYSSKRGYTHVGVQRDGQQRVIPFDQPPETPSLWHAGMEIPEFIAPADLKLMREIGTDKFIAAIKAGNLVLSPRPMKYLTEDTLLNVAPPSPADMTEIGEMISTTVKLRGYKPKKRRGST